MNVVDEYGLYNAKIVHDGAPSGNDGWILTAYAAALGFPIDRVLLQQTFDTLPKKNRIPLERLPGKPEPPPSRDVVMGWVALDLLAVEDLQKNFWRSSPYALPRFNLLKTLAALWRMRGAHRNALWMDVGEPHLYRFAFSVPIQDRAFYLRRAHKFVPFRYRVHEWVSRVFFPPKSPSSKLIAWFKRMRPFEKEVVGAYFPEGHPFVTSAGGTADASKFILRRPCVLASPFD